MKGKIIAVCLIAIVAFVIYGGFFYNPFAGHDKSCVNELANLPLLNDSQTISSSDPRIQHFMNDGCGDFIDQNGNRYPITSNFIITGHTKMELLK